MPQPQALSTTQLDDYLNRINTGGVAEVVKVYQELQDKGYHYAGWAKGVATAQTVTGIAAIDYLTGTAWMGLGGDECKNLTATQIDSIRVGMADGYVRALLADAKRPENNGVVSSDVDFRDTQAFHQEVFERNGLSINNWTLQTPMELIRLTEGDAAAEAYWVRLRETGGDGLDAILQSQWLYTKIGKLANGSDPAIAQQALDWIDQVPGIINFDAIGRTWETMKTWLTNNSFPDYSGLSGMLGPSGLVYSLLHNQTLATDWINAKYTLSPLILDLDGDFVVETQSKTAGIHFDHAGDGFAESTGWAGKDDGLLVRDLNGDGAINNGGELFGNNTRLSNGQKAENGFEALADLDSNRDGKINSADAAWNTLRVWKDADSDAQTDTGELLTLADAGVREVNLAYTDTSGTPDQHGNEHKQSGSYTTTAGTTHAVHDVWFGTDNWNTIDQRTPIELSSTVAAMPEVIGAGMLGSLRQAMMRDASGQLIAAVNAYLNTSNLGQRDNLLQDVLYRWAGVFEQDPALRGPYFEDGRKLAVLEAFFGEQYVQLGGGDTGPTINDPGPVASMALLELFGNVAANLGAKLDAHGRDAPFYNAINLDWNESTQAFSIDASGVETLIREIHSQQPQQALDNLRQFIFNLQALGTTEVLKALAVSGNLQGDDIDQLLAHANWTWGTINDDKIMGDFYQDSLLFGWNGNDSLYGIHGNDTLDGGAGNDYLEGGGGADVYLFGKGSGQDNIYNYDNDAVGTNADTIQLGAGITTTGVTLTRNYFDLIIQINGTEDSLKVQSYFHNDGTFGHVVENLKFADGTIWDVNTIKAKVLASTTGNDNLYGYATADTISAGDGNDTVYGQAGNDTLDGGAGEDQLHGEDGNDIIRGGTQNDFLDGGNGADNLQGQDGDDTIYGQAGNDILNGGAGKDLLDGGAGNDSYYVDNVGDVTTEAAAAGTDTVISSISWTLGANLENLALTGKANLSGTGNALNNVLTGNAGANTLNGGAGNDTLNGGKGADTLLGGTGNDTYVVDNTGDVVSEAANAGRDLVRSSVSYTLGANLEKLTLTGTAAINATGNTLNNGLTGNAGANTLNGGAGNDNLNGGAGEDQLYGGDGNDALFGGTGNDLLYGGNGHDTFTFSKGDGRDTIYVAAFNGTDANETLVLRDIRSTEVNLIQYDGSLYVQQKGSTTDHVKIVGHFGGGSNALDKLIFADGLTWDTATINANSMEAVHDPEYV